MATFLARRAVQSLLVLLIISLVAFVLVQAIPGNPARLALGPRASEQSVQILEQEYHLDEPVLSQYWHFISHSASLDFGSSIRSRQPVGPMLLDRVTPTMLIIAYAAFLSTLLAVGLGVLSAVRAGRPVDSAVQVGGMFAIAMPPFWLALMLVLAFAVGVPLFATTGYESGVGGILRTLTLPALTITCGLAPLLIRSVRSSVLENLGADYATAARSRGLGPRRILFRHVLRNSLLSTVTILGSSIAFLVSTTIVVEYVFAIPGIGALSVNAVASRDFPIVQSLVLLFGTLALLANLVTDLVYAWLDPRVRL
ncbi:MAG TPA: ABC transporter permease [Solirubrobacterales bacterium]|nr:ABC transporter permease [Solirubrobacterales bacterium]